MRQFTVYEPLKRLAKVTFSDTSAVWLECCIFATSITTLRKLRLCNCSHKTYVGQPRPSEHSSNLQAIEIINSDVHHNALASILNQTPNLKSFTYSYEISSKNSTSSFSVRSRRTTRPLTGGALSGSGRSSMGERKPQNIKI